MSTFKILSLGACLNDLLLRESDDYLKKSGRDKGGMSLVEHPEIRQALAKSAKQPASAPGGSACNTAVGLARLGVESHFIGKRGDDAPGCEVERQLKEWGVHCKLKQAKGSTGQVLSIITPDAQRTMMTYLGAAAQFGAGDLQRSDFAGFDLVLLEGYLLFNGDLVEKALEHSKSVGAKVALDLSSFDVVRIHRKRLDQLIEKGVDLLIANEDEAQAFTDLDPEKSLESFAKLTATAVVKLGAEGVLIARGQERVKVPGQRVPAIDTTGAGDLWASGFLCGLSRGWDLQRSAKLGNRMGAEVVSVLGATVPEPVYTNVRREFGL